MVVVPIFVFDLQLDTNVVEGHPITIDVVT